MRQHLRLCAGVFGVSLHARVGVVQGGQHVGDVPPLKNEHAQLTLQPLDLVVLTDGGVARQLRFELGGLLFQLPYLRVQFAAEVLSLT